MRVSLSSNKCWSEMEAESPSERAQLRLLPPPAVHFKVRVLAAALPLRDLLADAGLSFNRSDIGALQRGQSRSWFRF